MSVVSYRCDQCQREISDARIIMDLGVYNTARCSPENPAVIVAQRYDACSKSCARRLLIAAAMVADPPVQP